MKAILITACGCRKEEPTTYPPPPRIVVPIKEPITSPQDIEDAFKNEKPIKSIMRARAFELFQFTNFGPDVSIAEYHEVLEP